MQSDDQFRLAFDTATAHLDTWAERHRDCAALVVERIGTFWRLSVVPKAANACPVELILHRDTQSFDIQLGTEAYEGRAVSSLDMFAPLLDAVVAGHVVTRQTLSAAGAIPLLVETIVQPEHHIAWIAERKTDAGTKMATPDVITRNRHWLPYRRG